MYSFGTFYNKAVVLAYDLGASVQLANRRSNYYNIETQVISISPEQIENHYEFLLCEYEGELEVDVEEIALASLLHELGHHFIRGEFTKAQRQEEEVKAWMEAETFYFCIKGCKFPEYIHVHIHNCLSSYGYDNWVVPPIKQYTPPQANKLWKLLTTKLF